VSGGANTFTSVGVLIDPLVTTFNSENSSVLYFEYMILRNLVLVLSSRGAAGFDHHAKIVGWERLQELDLRQTHLK
jgi:hypothetical protein